MREPTRNTLWDDREFVLSQITRPDELRSMLVMTPALAQPARATVARLEHAYGLRNELDPSWAARPVEIIRHHGQPALLIEYPGGEILAGMVGKPWDIAPFLRVAIGLAVSLGHLHERGLVHKDIKPANILVNLATGEVWLAGFGIASRLARERQALAPAEVVAGTLAYMAPEQTGRMNRSIDSRSDLYAYGVTLYEMLTGALPFTASDPMEWIHCHIARPAAPPTERVDEIPPAISAIICKLLAKNAEDRYQTAAGVEADFRKCLAEWESLGQVEPFPLGAYDVSDRLLIPERLYGREREIDTLVAAFDRVLAGGIPELVLVTGYSGIGKSSVVNELHKVLVPPRGLFASGKFDQYKRDIPYATLAHAFQNLIRSILCQSEAALAQWRDALRQALGANGQLVVNLIPELELIIGKQPPVSDLPPQDEQNRFQMVFRQFLGVFARAEHPLALFLDDLQWLDAATLALVENLMTEPDVRYLLLVGAYRDNEVTSSHPLTRTLEAIRKTEATVHQIVLAPLGLADIGRLISDALHCEPERAQPLAQLVQEKTAGNPFFTIQFLTALADERLLTFDSHAGAWTWDLAHIRAKGYTDNVVDLMIGKLNRLPVVTRQALKQLACLGNSAQSTTLSMVHKASPEEIHGALWEAVRAGLVFRLDGEYAFLHDRVQEAAYALTPESERAGVHLRIGRLLAAQTREEKMEETIFEILNQFDRGATLITAPEERERVAELYLIGGMRAKASTAYASALKYLATGAAFLPQDSWERLYSLTFALEFHQAECELLTADLAGAEERLWILSQRAAKLADIAAVACSRLTLYTTLDRSDRGVEVCLEYLRRVGIQWSPHPTKDEVQQEYERIWQQLGNRPIEEIVDLPLMSDQAWCATMDVLSQVVTPALFSDENLVCLVICRMANLSLEHGNSDGSCFAYVWLGMIMGPHFGDYRAGFRFGRVGFNLVERGLDRFEARVYMSFGNLVNPWTRHVPTGRPLVRRAFDTATRMGDLTFAAYSWNNLITNLLASGDPLDEVQREAENGLEFARRARFGLVIDIITAQLRLVRTLRGLTPDFSSFNDAEFDEGGFEQHLEADPRLALPTCWYWIRKLQGRVYAGAYVSAVAAASKAEPLLWTSPSFLELAEYHFYGALALAANLDADPASERPRRLEALAAHYKQLQIWAENCPENFGTRAALVAAELARIEGRELDAERLYEDSIRLAHEHGFIQNEGLANELAARFYAGRGFETISHAYLRNARYCYVRWGAEGKVRQLDQAYPHLRHELGTLPPTTTIGAPLEHLDHAAVVRTSQVLSSEIVLEKLIRRLMVITVEHAGAERALLILPQGDEPCIEAEATTGRDGVAVHFLRRPPEPSELSHSVLQYVLRTRESVILNDASVPNIFSTDHYMVQKHVRSVLCLPLVRQAEVTGVLYLENNVASHVFTPDRVELLNLLASQAAISLENARLYTSLQQSEHRLRLAIDAIPAMVGTMLPDGSVDFLNKRWQEYTGLPSQQGFGNKWTASIHPDDVVEVVDAFRTALATGEPFEHEGRIRRADGEYRWFQQRALPLREESGRIAKWYAINTDIEDRKRAEEALRESERNLRLLIEAIPGFVSVNSPEGKLEYVNQRLLDYTGMTAGDPAKFDWTSVIYPDDVESLGSSWLECVAVGRPHEAEFRLRRFDGIYRWVHSRAEPLRDSEGRIMRWYSLLHDVDDRKNAEESLRRTQAQLSRASHVATVGELAASIAHEVNQPLAAVVANGNACLRWLYGDAPNLAKARQAAERIVRDGNDAGEVVRRIRALFKRAAPEKLTLDINEIIGEVLHLLHGEILRKRVTVETDLEERDSAALIVGDRVQLQQVILNLLINGIEAMDTVVERPRKLFIRSQRQDDNSVLVEIRDYGIGLDDPEKVFEAFYTTKESGMGMGLPICRSIIEAHQGRLWTTRGEGPGAAFFFTLPRQWSCEDEFVTAPSFFV
jgi:PAS domain S-box-containing protein